jgi:NADH dehydrogenase
MEAKVMQPANLHVVTGAFGYSGKYITTRLLQAGCRVRTLTNSPQRPNPFQGQVEAHPLDFDDPARLAASLEGAEVLYNTYWVRFNHGDFNHSQAVNNTLNLFEAARQAGVRRVVHVSITNPSHDSPLEYFHGKAVLEQALIATRLSYAILRPAVLFGKEDILINNIAWALRRFPVFAMFGDGRYRLQPIYVDDLACLAVEQGLKTENIILDATGPETFTYRALVESLERIIGKPRPILPVSPGLGYLASWGIGKWMGDVFVTREEISGLMADLLWTASAPAGTTKLTDWAAANAQTLGKHYASELARRFYRDKSYL